MIDVNKIIEKKKAKAKKEMERQDVWAVHMMGIVTKDVANIVLRKIKRGSFYFEEYSGNGTMPKGSKEIRVKIRWKDLYSNTASLNEVAQGLPEYFEKELGKLYRGNKYSGGRPVEIENFEYEDFLTLRIPYATVVIYLE